MITRSRRLLIAAVAMAIPATAGGQAPVQSFDQLERVLKVGQRVVVTDAEGRETKGKVQDLTSGQLVVQASDTRTFREPDVLKIRRASVHGVRNGILAGLGIGAAVGVAGFAATYHSGDDAVYYWAYIGTWLSPAVGAGVGAIAGRAWGNETVYIAPARTGAARVTVSPLLAKRATGLSVSVRF